MEMQYKQFQFDDYGIPYKQYPSSSKELRPGDQVVMVDCLEAERYTGRVWTVRSTPWEVCSSHVVLLEGYCGGFDVERLKLATNTNILG